MELYAIIAAIVTGAFGLLYALVRVKSAQADRSDALAKVARDEAEQAATVIKMADKRAENLRIAKQVLADRQKLEQEEVNDGKRDHFDSSDF